MIEVRRARTTDAAALAALAQEAHAVHAAALPDVFQPASRGPVLTPAEAARVVEAPGQLWLLALDGGAAVGYAHAEVQEAPASPYKLPSRRLHVHAMGVRAAARRRGVSRALLAAVRAEAAERGLPEVSLEVYAFNSAARALYAREGFAPLRELLVWRHPGAQGIHEGEAPSSGGGVGHPFPT